MSCIPISASPYRIDRASHPGRATVEDVRVDLRRRDVAMAQELLHGADIAAVFEQMRGERMPERVRSGPLRDAGAPHGLLDAALEDGLV